MLTKEQAKKNQETYGWNELAAEKKKNVFLVFLEQFRDFLVLVLIVAAVVSAILGDAESAIVILMVITLNAILGTAQTFKAEKSLEALREYSAPEAKVMRDGILYQIPAREVTVGDEVIVEAGDCIPADGKLLRCASLKVDESALTGESTAVEKSLAEVPAGAALGDRTNEVFSGSFATYGRGAYEVTAIGMNTEVGKIARLLKSASAQKTPLQVSLDDFGRKLSILILVLCGIIFALSVFRGEPVLSAFMFAVALAVAAIPEALSSIVTIVLAFGTQKMAREHAIIRKLQAVEGLGSVSVICSDKTGTLTQNKMTVEDYYVDGARVPVAQMDLDRDNQRELLRMSVLCNDASCASGQEVGDPTETALLRLSEDLGQDVQRARRNSRRELELPFDSDRKMMSVVCRRETGAVMITKGAVESVLRRTTSIRDGGAVRPITDGDRKQIERQNAEFSRDGLRVLAFGYKDVERKEKLNEDDECDLVFVGLIAMMDPPREESRAAVEECIKAGIKPVMITGDHKVTASAIAKRLGILKDPSEACDGTAVERMSDEELRNAVDKISVYARVSPEHKIRIVRAWQDRGRIVAMTGDGVNDAPALKQANVGVAMGITGTEVSKNAAAMVLTDDNFATIVKAVENGRNIYQNIRRAIQFLLSGNFAAILVVLAASIASLPVPFAPVHLLFINLLTDSLPAIALGLEPHTAKVMEDKPRPANRSILTRDYLRRIGTEGLVIGIMTMTAFLLGLQMGGPALARTMAFGTLCSSRLVHGFNCKADEPVLFTRRFFNNKYLLGAFLLGLFLITSVLTIPVFRGLFQVAGMSLAQLGMIYGLALANLPVIQLLKKITVSLSGRRHAAESAAQ